MEMVTDHFLVSGTATLTLPAITGASRSPNLVPIAGSLILLVGKLEFFVVHEEYLPKTISKPCVDLLEKHSTDWTQPNTIRGSDMIIDEKLAIYPIPFVRETCIEEYSIPEATWYLHDRRMPQPDVSWKGWQWYSWEQYQQVRTWWAARPSVKRRLQSA
jgi:hypothetical protein